MVATDQPPGKTAVKYWSANQQHVDSLEEIFFPEMVHRERLYRNASFQHVDMNSVPAAVVGFVFVGPLVPLNISPGCSMGSILSEIR
jgi:hypothetical protein